jgi:PAS domain S-box-containing protein
MPFRPDPFLTRFEPLRRWRQRPLIGYSVAIGAVAAAALLRLGFWPVFLGVPLMTFYPAVAAATAVGGTRPGLVGLILSVVLANYMLHAPHLGFSLDSISLVQTALFVFVSALIVVQIMLLNEAIERLARQADNSTAILESQPTGILAVDDQGRITLVNSAVERQLGYSREELLNKPVELLVPRDLRAEHEQARDTFLQEPTPRRMGAGRDLHALAKDGSLLPVEIGLNPVSHGGRKGALATIVDISERKNLEWRTQMLANEVQHRSRNLLTIIQALAQRMLPKAESRNFTDVLAAIARTHELFGTATTGSLRAIIEGELAPLRDQCDIALCDLLVTAKVGQDMTLIVHELVTNSVKYGALSKPEGRVLVTAAVEDGHFHLLWEEIGGPAVAKPGRQGLGGIILRDLAEGFADEVSLDYAQQGFRYALSTRLDRLSNVAPLHPKASGTEG